MPTISRGEAEIRTVAANNVHENVGRVQEGGTCSMAFGSIVKYYDVDKSGKDETGLGRWTVMTFAGSDGITTRFLCGYKPCYNKKRILTRVISNNGDFYHSTTRSYFSTYEISE